MLVFGAQEDQPQVSPLTCLAMFTPSQHILIDRHIYDSVWNKPVQLIIEKAYLKHAANGCTTCPFSLPIQSVETSQTPSNSILEVSLNKLRAPCLPYVMGYLVFLVDNSENRLRS